MSNLGKYQDIVTSAKLVGGVDNLIAIIRNDAVANAAPRLLLRGASWGVVGGVFGVEGGRRTVNHLRSKKAEREQAAKQAVQQGAQQGMQQGVTQAIAGAPAQPAAGGGRTPHPLLPGGARGRRIGSRWNPIKESRISSKAFCGR